MRWFKGLGNLVSTRLDLRNRHAKVEEVGRRRTLRKAYMKF